MFVGQELVREKLSILQVKGKVREFYFQSGKIGISHHLFHKIDGWKKHFRSM